MGFFDIFRISEIKAENEQLKQRLAALGCDEYEEVQRKIAEAKKEFSNLNEEMADQNTMISRLREEISQLQEKQEKIDKQVTTQTKKLKRSKELYKSVDYCISNFLETDGAERLSPSDSADYDAYAPSVILKLHSMDVKSLRNAFKENDKAIDRLLSSYAARYTTKANQTIYQLMVIALRAELQNILYDLKYEKLDQAVEKVKIVTRKYLQIAGEGNKSIVGTLTRFIGEIEYLFIDAVKIEYNYYVKKEQARQEQLALKQQMREEAKYQAEIEKANEALSNTEDEAQIATLKSKILELQGQLSDVTIKKDEISKLQNGKAGNVYVISNLGSFGENVFKIGMTRRMDPQERVDELGSASVPFKFDVHSFIFSDNAVGLENKLHTILNDKRVNKVNMRKEFFYSTLDELEALVNELDPTAEFNKTMLAEEFRQSQSTDTPYTSDLSDDSDDDE